MLVALVSAAAKPGFADHEQVDDPVEVGIQGGTKVLTSYLASQRQADQQ